MATFAKRTFDAASYLRFRPSERDDFDFLVPTPMLRTLNYVESDIYDTSLFSVFATSD